MITAEQAFHQTQEENIRMVEAEIEKAILNNQFSVSLCFTRVLQNTINVLKKNGFIVNKIEAVFFQYGTHYEISWQYGDWHRDGEK